MTDWIDSLRGVSDERKAAMRSMAMTGSKFALGRWFQPAKNVSGPVDDMDREFILNQAYAATHVGVAPDGVMIARTPDGAVMIERSTVQGCPIVTFDYVANGSWNRARFWMNASSVADLDAVLAALPRVSFDALLIGAPV